MLSHASPRTGVEPPQSVPFPAIGPDDPQPVSRVPASVKPTPSGPITEPPVRHPQLSRQVGQPPLVLPELPGILAAVAQAAARQQLPHRRRRVAPRGLRRPGAFPVAR